MRTLLVGLLVLLALAGCNKPPYTGVNNAELKALLAQGVPIYDVRRPDEWQQTGVVQGSHQLTFVDAGSRLNPAFFPTFTQQVARDQPVIIICRSGSRSDKLARELMAEHGYTKVYNVSNGMNGWLAEANPVVRN
jgi:rhodanese-related sulfurtransferase